MPFLHITTRIEDRKHDELLFDLEENSFPSFLVLDAGGGVLARHREPATAGAFKITLKKVERSIALRKQAAGGDRNARIDLALLECELGRIDLADLEEVLEPLGKLGAAQQRLFLGLAADETVSEMIPMIRRGRFSAEILADVGESFFEHYEQGGVPAARRHQHAYWLGLAYFAAGRKDTALLDRCLEELEPIAARNTFVKQLRAELARTRQALEQK